MSFCCPKFSLNILPVTVTWFDRHLIGRYENWNCFHFTSSFPADFLHKVQIFCDTFFVSVPKVNSFGKIKTDRVIWNSKSKTRYIYDIGHLEWRHHMIEDSCNTRNFKIVFVKNIERSEHKSKSLFPIVSDMIFHFNEIKFRQFSVGVNNRQEAILNRLIHLFEHCFQLSWTPVNVGRLAWVFMGLKFMDSKINVFKM